MAWFTKASEIKVGVLGYGGAFNMGRNHMKQMSKAGMEPFAVCEIDPERLKVATEDFPGIETYDDLDAMLKQSDVDLIVHITPHNLHYPLAAKCLKAGKHVITEKPFVLTTAEADKLIALAKKNDLLVSTYHNRHWDGNIRRAVKDIREKGVIGDIVKVECHMGSYGMPRDWWRTSREISGGILYDWGVHLLEYSLQVLGEAKITEVSGFSHEGFWGPQLPKSYKWREGVNEDEANAIVRFDTGALLYLTISQLRSYQRPGKIEFIGTKGTYVLDGPDNVLRQPKTVRTEDGKKKVEIVEKPAKHLKGDPGGFFYNNIAAYMTGQEELIITPEWARRPIHILDLAGRSARAGRAMKAKYA